VDAVLDLPPEARAPYLDQACAEPEVRRYVESLIYSYNQAGNFLDESTSAKHAKTLSEPDAEAWNGRRLGAYQIIERIGEGGMGEVYRAIRADDQYQMQVAIKLVRIGFDSRFTLARFKAERQILANLDHPNITRLLDGGETEEGQPFLVMEYVRGLPLDQYCDQHKLNVNARLELFRVVCAAVQFAHQNLVIHRDLKPGNILVTEDGTPKLLDFGIAKIMEPDGAGPAMARTQTMVRLLTPEYASPEQFRGGPFTTATDVYSLSVVLYELLTGHWPYRITASSQQDIAKAICEQEPEKPSTAAGRMEAATSTAARLSAFLRNRRHERVEKQRPRLASDVDSILLKALRKEPERRYASVEQFSEDIRRYLAGLPVLARKDTIRYRAGKFVNRHKPGVAAGLLVVLVLVTGLLATMREGRIAQREAATAQAVNDFLRNDLLAQASVANQAAPNAKPDPELKVRTALDRAAAAIAGKFDRQPDVEAAIRDTIGQTYMDLGLYPQAQAQLEQALKLQRRVLGTGNPKTLKTISLLGQIADLQGRYVDAEALFSQALTAQRRVLGPEHSDTLISLNGLAGVYYSLGKYPQAEDLDNQTLQIRRRLLGPEHPDTLKSYTDLAIDYQVQGKYAQAEALDRQTLEIQRRVRGPEHPDTLKSMNNLAIVDYMQGKYAEAEELYRETLEIRRRILGPEHPNTLDSVMNLATCYYFEGKYAQAEELHSQAVEIKRRLLGPEHPNTLNSMNNLAAVYGMEGKHAQAEALFTKTIEISRRVLGLEHPLTLAFLAEFASFYQREGKYALAETHAAQSLAGRERTLGREHPDTVGTAADLALAYLSQGKFAASEALAREALEFYRKKLPDDWQRFRAESLLGASLAGEKKYIDAEPLLLEGYKGMASRKGRIEVPDWYHLDRAREWVVQLYQAWGKPAQAAELAER